MTLARTQYVRSGDGDIACQVFGEGPRDVVVAFDWASHLEVLADFPPVEEQLLALARFARVIWFDMRGIGMSSPITGGLAPMETWMDDLIAVLDAAGSERATVVAQGYTGQMAVLAAVTHPDRVASLVLINGFARFARADDYPAGLPARMHGALLDGIESQWGSGTLAYATFPEASARPGFVEWWGRIERFGATPSVARARMAAILSLDVRHLLPLVAAPTLVVHSARNPFVRIDHGRYVAEQIPGAKLLELDTADHMPPPSPELLGAIEELVTGARGDAAGSERALATVLFVDVVGSTVLANELGDERWRRALDRFERIAAEAVQRYGGRVHNTTGDGIVATFDGPARAIRCAALVRAETLLGGIEVRAGLHTGEVTRRGDDVAGIAVHLAARVAATAGPGDVLVTRTVRDLVSGSGIAFDDRGEHELKGVPERWALYAASF